jgi:hypothetical protein
MADVNRPGSAGVPARPRFRSRSWRAGNAIVGVLARAGIGPIHLLITRAGGSGRQRVVPVVPVDLDGRRWLVAPYGAVSWVHDARAAGRVTLRYGRSTHRYAIREATAQEAGPVLKRYVAVAAKTRAQFDARPDSPPQDFVREAARHPVFELTPWTGEPGRTR